jgi:hypothetical protein
MRLTGTSTRLPATSASAKRALLDVPGATLLMLPRLLIDEPFRVRLIEHYVGDPVVRSFWINEYAGYGSSFRSEAIAPIQNKIGKALMVPTLRNMLPPTTAQGGLRVWAFPATSHRPAALGLGMPRPASTSPLLWLYALNSIVRLRHALSVFPIGEKELSAISQLRPDLIYIGTLDDMARKNLRPKQFVTN